MEESQTDLEQPVSEQRTEFAFFDELSFYQMTESHLLVLDVARTRDWFRLTNVDQVPSVKKIRYTPTASTEKKRENAQR